ncbi:MAG TPA: DJ-1/PfpI family protein [Candidatus Sulfotelmatobacter sp.]|nr:DJ-1/PfpI family protein [Candidatus Sulfotelmatobacter sp.]
MSITIGLLLFPDAEELDFVGPWEVFTMAAKADKGAAAGLKAVLIAETAGTVRCAKGMRVIADHGFADAPELDVLLVPGGMGTRREVDNRKLLDWIAAAARPCRWVTSVCTGSYLLAEAGPARGRNVTTHWGFVDTFRKRGTAEVRTGVRFVRDGNVVSSAGVSAGIDMALWLVGQLFDPAYARLVQRNMEYEPAPPYTADV